MRIPLLAISVTAGCALNFGQVKVDGTLNATADTKIDTKIDTTVNASASVTQTGGEQQAATPTPTATPGPGTLYVRHVPILSGPDSSMGHYNIGDGGRNTPIHYINFSASEERDQVIIFTRFTQKGSIDLDHPIFVDLHLSSQGNFTAIPSTLRGIADFNKSSGLMVVPAGKTIQANVGVQWSYMYPYAHVDPVAAYDYDLFNNFFLGKDVRLVIESPNDIKTMSNAKIEGDFPNYGPLISF